MSKLSKDLMTELGVKPKLRLGLKQNGGGVKSTGPHKVKFISDKVVQGKDPKTGKDCEYVKYLFEENGEQKVYQTRKLNKDTGELSYFVQGFADIERGDDVILTMKKEGIKNYIEIVPVKAGTSVDVGDDNEHADDDDTPIIE